MKRLILLMICCFTALLILFSGCNKSCTGKRPKNIKPIDWENYNDVETVYWNIVHCCSESSDFEYLPIKITGWKPWNLDQFSLCDYPDAYYGNSPMSVVYITCSLPGFRAMLDTCDLTKKCYVEGIIRFNTFSTGWECKVEPQIEITNINNIYFK